MKISLRKAGFPDIEFLWYLRNQPDVYNYFKEARVISWKEHINWIIPIILELSLKDVFIIQKSNIPIGQIRFDYKDFDISVSVLKEFRGRGIAAKALNLAIKEIKKAWTKINSIRGKQQKVKKLIAEVHIKNRPSAKLFEKLGFKLKIKKGNWLIYILNL